MCTQREGGVGFPGDTVSVVHQTERHNVLYIELKTQIKSSPAIEAYIRSIKHPFMIFSYLPLTTFKLVSFLRQLRENIGLLTLFGR